MNSFGRIFRISLFGESHGAGIGVTLDGCPCGIALESGDFEADLQRRKPAAKGGTPRREADTPQLLSGVFQGKTTGAPLTLWFENKTQDSTPYKNTPQQPRPGHADFVAGVRYQGFADYRGGGHFSGRLTLGMVAAGVVAKKTLGNQIDIQAQISQVGGQNNIAQALEEAIQKQDTLGGLITCTATGIPVGWGEPLFDSLEGVLAHALFAIPAVKGVSFGAGFQAATWYGTQHNDMLLDTSGKTQTNHAGGILGGLSNGNPLHFSVAIKPPSSTPQPQKTLHIGSGKMETLQVKGQHDLCIALRAPVVVEAVTAMVLADFACLNKAMT